MPNRNQDVTKMTPNEFDAHIAGGEPTHGVWCTRFGSSQFGARESWEKVGGKQWYGTEAEATARAAKYNKQTTSSNLHYEALELDH